MVVWKGIEASMSVPLDRRPYLARGPRFTDNGHKC